MRASPLKQLRTLEKSLLRLLTCNLHLRSSKKMNPQKMQSIPQEDSVGNRFTVYRGREGLANQGRTRIRKETVEYCARYVVFGVHRIGDHYCQVWSSATACSTHFLRQKSSSDYGPMLLQRLNCHFSFLGMLLLERGALCLARTPLLWPRLR